MKSETDQKDAEEKDTKAIKTSENLNESQKLFDVVMEELDNNYKSRDGFIGISTGIDKLDSLLLGLREGDLNIIASRPSIGKTTFSLTMFMNIISRGVNALYISFDKYENELLKNVLSIKAHIDNTRFESGFLSKSDFKNVLETTESVYSNSGSIYFKTFFNTDLIKLKAFIKEKVENDKIKVVFIDYLTMIIPAPTYTNRWEQVAEISRSLKTMAMEFKIPFIVLCPIHRNIVDKTPEIIDLSESGSIEYDADRVLLLYKNEKKQKTYNLNNDQSLITVYVAKNRRGPTKAFDLLFDYRNKLCTEIKDEDTI